MNARTGRGRKGRDEKASLERTTTLRRRDKTSRSSNLHRVQTNEQIEALPRKRTRALSNHRYVCGRCMSMDVSIPPLYLSMGTTEERLRGEADPVLIVMSSASWLSFFSLVHFPEACGRQSCAKSSAPFGYY